jgi:excisionase family DNA binding protein
MCDDITLDLNEAAAFLKMSPEALRRKAKAGEIPGRKVGKRWCFIKSDLVAYVRSGYASPRQAS